MGSRISHSSKIIDEQSAVPMHSSQTHWYQIVTASGEKRKQEKRLESVKSTDKSHVQLVMWKNISKP